LLAMRRMIEANTRVNGTNQGGAGQKSPDWRQVGEWIATRQFLVEVWVNERG